jgi:hypothetical protein
MEGKKIALLLIFCCLLVTGAAAYIVTLSAPRTVNAGEPIVVSGSSNLPPGLTTTVTLSKKGSSGIISQNEVTIQEGGNFTVSFATEALEEATYRVEIQESVNEYPYGSGSKTWLFVDVIDRRDELTVSSPRTQTFDGTLEVSGTISTVDDSGLRMEVIRGDVSVIGPTYIATRNGMFQEEVPIEEGGIYTVNLIDTTSYRWSIQFQVSVPTTIPTTAPVTPETTAPTILQASASASRVNPAYFKVDTNIGILRASTSSGVDWVVEEIDESGEKEKINLRGADSEEITLPTRGGTVYFKIYPNRFEEQATVILYVENARNVETCPSCATIFGDAAPTTTASLPAILVFLAILAGIGLWRRRS